MLRRLVPLQDRARCTVRLRVYYESGKRRKHTVKLGGREKKETGTQGRQPRRKGDKESDRERRGGDVQSNRIRTRKRERGGRKGSVFMQQ